MARDLTWHDVRVGDVLEWVGHEGEVYLVLGVTPHERPILRLLSLWDADVLYWSSGNVAPSKQTLRSCGVVRLSEGA